MTARHFAHRLRLPLVLLPALVLAAPAQGAGRWAGRNADVTAVYVLRVDQQSLFDRLSDMATFRAMMPADCATDWEIGDPPAGMGAHGTVRYDIAGMHRKLGFVVSKVEPPHQVDIEHLGNKGFVTRFVLATDTAGGTEVEMHTYLNAPKWPFTAYFFKKVQPAWLDCYERALQNLGATNPAPTP